MNKKITSLTFILLFAGALVMTSCSSSKGGKKAHRCPAYGGDTNTAQVDDSKLPA